MAPAGLIAPQRRSAAVLGGAMAPPPRLRALALLALAPLAPTAVYGEISSFRIFHPCNSLRELDGALFIIAGSRAHPGDDSHGDAHGADAHGADAHGDTAAGDAHGGTAGDAHGATAGDAHGATARDAIAGAEGHGTATEDPHAAAAHETTAAPHGDAHATPAAPQGHETTAAPHGHETTAAAHDGHTVVAHTATDAGHRRLNSGAEEGVPGEHEEKHAPYYKGAKSRYYIHFGHVCSAHGKVEYGWLIDEALPPTNDTTGELHGSSVQSEHEACQHIGQIQWFMHDGPPVGTTNWRMSCDGEFREVPLTIRVEERSHETTSECVPSEHPGLALEAHAAIVADVRLIDLEYAWLRIDMERGRRLDHVHYHEESHDGEVGSNEGLFFPAVLYPKQALQSHHVDGHAVVSDEFEVANSHAARWLAASFSGKGIYMVEIAVEMEGPEVFLRAVRARFLENHTSFRTRDPGRELSELFHAPGILALGVGCPGEIQVDSLTLDFLYRRIPDLASPPSSVYKGFLIFIFVVLLLALAGMKVVMCRRTLKEARSLEGSNGARGREQLPYSEESAGPGQNSLSTAPGPGSLRDTARHSQREAPDEQQV